MYIRKITELSFNELNKMGIQEDYGNLCALGLEDGNKYVLFPTAHADYLKDAGATMATLAEELANVVAEMEKTLMHGNRIGAYVGRSDAGHFLSLKLSFVSADKTMAQLPIITHMGTSTQTIIGAGVSNTDASALWVRDCYYQFLKSYFPLRYGIPQAVLADIDSRYIPSDFDSVVNCINQILDWYADTFGSLYLNSEENLSVITCIKNVLAEGYNHFANDGRLAVIIAPMYYGNKDALSGSGWIELTPNTWNAEISMEDVRLDCVGVFSPQSAQVLVNAQKKHTTNLWNDGIVAFDDASRSSYAEIVNQQLYLVCREILNMVRHRYAVKDEEGACLSVYFTVEMGKVHIDKYELTTAGQIVCIPMHGKKRDVPQAVIVQESKEDTVCIKKTEVVNAPLSLYDEYLMMYSADQLSESLTAKLTAMFTAKGVTLLDDDKQFLNVLNDVVKGDETLKSILKILVTPSVRRCLIAAFSTDGTDVAPVLDGLSTYFQAAFSNVDVAQALVSAIRCVLENGTIFKKESVVSETVVERGVAVEKATISEVVVTEVANEPEEDMDGFNPEDILF